MIMTEMARHALTMLAATLAGAVLVWAAEKLAIRLRRRHSDRREHLTHEATVRRYNRLFAVEDVDMRLHHERISPEAGLGSLAIVVIMVAGSIWWPTITRRGYWLFVLVYGFAVIAALLRPLVFSFWGRWCRAGLTWDEFSDGVATWWEHNADPRMASELRKAYEADHADSHEA